MLVHVPRSPYNGLSPAATALMWRVQHAAWQRATRALPVHPQAGAQTRPGFEKVDGASLYLVLADSAAQREALSTLLQRLRVLEGMEDAPAPQLRRRERSMVIQPSHARDAPVRHLRALLGEEQTGAPGAGLHSGPHMKAMRAAMRLVIARPIGPDTPSTLLAEEATGREAALVDWVRTTIQRVEANRDARIVIPSAVEIPQREELPGAVVPERRVRVADQVPATQLAAAFRQVLFDSLPAALRHGVRGAGGSQPAAEPGGAAASAGAASGGATSSTGGAASAAPPRRLLDSVRAVTDAELVAGAGEDTLTMENAPELILPSQVFEDNGLNAVRTHVRRHTVAQPQKLDIPVAAAHAVAGCSTDFDGCAINLRHMPPRLRQSYTAELSRARQARYDERSENARALAGPARNRTEFGAILRQCVTAAAARVQNPDSAATAHAPLSASATLRGENSHGTARFAQAAAASALDALASGGGRPSPPEAIAAVKVVFDCAATWGVLDGLRGQLVDFPSSGAPKHTDMSPTVDAAFARQGGSLLPSTEGRVTEPVKVVIVGAPPDAVAPATREILAAIVQRDGSGSVGVAREAGLAARAPLDSVAVAGGALTTLAVLVLLLARHTTHASWPATRPFAFLKA